VISSRARRITGFFHLVLGWFLATAAGANPVCLTVQNTGATTRYPVSIGDKFNLSFAHSIYGSQVEEQFRVTARGFQLIELRYAEPRLVEFYGHEWAANEHGRWVVRKLGPVLASLELHVSPGSSIGVMFGAERFSVKHNALSGGRARLELSACPKSNHG
jgi:hypothetical protein